MDWKREQLYHWSSFIFLINLGCHERISGLLQVHCSPITTQKTNNKHKTATIAIEYAQELDRSNDILPAIPYFFGRSDCITSPDGIKTRQFPDAHAGWRETINWFQRFLGFSARETIAITGAHTLGKTHQRFSGFETRPWVHRSFVLNNQYYQDIIAKKWTPVEVNCRSPFGC